VAGEDDCVDEDRYALDQWGVRRFVAAGDPLPDGWRYEGESKPKTAESAPAEQEGRRGGAEGASQRRARRPPT